MNELCVCPDIRVYHDLASGQLPPDSKESLLRHLEGCDSCVLKIQALPAEDTLVAWIQQVKTLSGRPEEKQLAPLIQRLIQLRQAGAAPAKAAAPARSFTFACPGCGKSLRVKEEAAGKKVKCPHCGQVAQTPAAVRPEGAAETPPAGQETGLFTPADGGTPAPITKAGLVSAVDLNRSSEDTQFHTSSKDQKLCSFLAPAQAPDELGRLGPYRVLKVLGAGGMGVVFRAEDPQLQRLVALKAMLPDLAANESARQRFLREARAAAKLHHDHIVTIYQVGEDRGAPFLAMEFLEGEALEDRLKREGKLPLAEVARIGREIAEGLQAAHEHGLIHRDIKPGNVWLEGKRGRVKILDFGLARSAKDDVHLTQSGAIVGTPAYMPPEQARGEAVDGRCDLYSLGCVLYRLCTGQLPFKGDNTMSLLLALATEQPKPLRELNADVPPALADLIMRLLAKDPAQRPATAREVVDALSAIDTGEPVVVKVARVPAPPRRRRRLAVAVAGGALVLAVMLTVIVIRLGKPEEGTVTIETVDPDVELVFTSGGKDFTVRDKKTGKEIKLPLGTYQVKLKDGKEGLKLDANEFTLMTRDDRALVKVTWKADDLPKSARADIPAPFQVAEPPPLAEWLKGRTILTVSQDGKSQFKTIQAALDALKPGQIVKVLDRGPYRERLESTPPEDTGLISEQGTVLEVPQWKGFAGHDFGGINGFRLNGFQMLAPAKKDFGAVSSWGPSGLVIENCLFKNPGGPAVCSINLDLNRAGPLRSTAWIRHCVIDAQVLIEADDGGRTTVIIEQNYFHASAPWCEAELKKLLIRRNIFDGVGPHFAGLKKTPAALEISNNTLLTPVHFVKSVPTQGVTIHNNIVRVGLVFREGAEKFQADADKNWKVGHNSYLHYRQNPDLITLAKTSTDCAEAPQFLSDDPADRDYLRLPTDSPLAKGGAGGAWPSYIGALPPGPAPKDGDWFTRLRQRWGDVAPADKPPSPPVQVPEPPPLAEWLKDRKVLSVAQDGSGQFKTIKAALDALKPHQVVKVLDRGPYRERLQVGTLPDDTGLISERQTVIESPAEPDDPALEWDHWFGPLEGFRLSGLHLLARPRNIEKGGTIFFTGPSGVVLENCCFGWTKPIDGTAVGFLFDNNETYLKPIVVRNCLFDNAGLQFGGQTARMPPVVIERNYFHNALLNGDGPCFQTVVIRHNVFDFPRGVIWIQKLKKVRETFEISNNTSTGSPKNGFPSIVQAAPKRGIIVRNNISETALGFDGGAEVREDALKNWQLDHNCYMRRGPLPKAASDVAAEAQFLSLDPKHPDYLRIAVDSPQAKGGAGGAWPSYIGALPPGPAPKDGDWFTRLRQRWGDVAPAVKPLSPPVQVPEPPPLAEWLKGRKILTVSQDGKSQFKTIQSALNALKPGQVVKVLDRGPYRERLSLFVVPEDTGLVSEHQTVLELSEWSESDKQPPVGHNFVSAEDFRVHGFALIFPTSRKDGIAFYVPGANGFVLENCFVQVPEKAELMAAVLIGLGDGTNRKPSWVRDCMIRGKLVFASHKPSVTVVAERNYLDGPADQALQTNGNFAKVVIRHNVFGTRATGATISINEMKEVDSLEVRNNTTTSIHPLTFAFSAPRKNVTILNNLRSQPGLLVFGSGAEKGLPAIIEYWRVGHNAYPRQLRQGELSWLGKQNIVPQASTDLLGEPKFLSLDPAHPDYLRLAADSPQAKGGTGGAWPSYIGAFPPGPAPKNGDWFTRLRAKWLKDKPAAGK